MEDIKECDVAGYYIRIPDNADDINRRNGDIK